MTKLYWLILSLLCVWRLTHLLAFEDGPGRVFARIRRLAGTGFWGEVLDCFNCLSLWVAAPLAFVLGGGWSEKLLLWPALSGAAMLLEHIIGPPAPIYTEDPVNNISEVTYELLRESEKRDSERDCAAGRFTADDHV